MTFSNQFQTRNKTCDDNIQKICKYGLTFPMANSPRSKNSNTPKNKKAIPNPASPTPISKNKSKTEQFTR